MSEEGDGALDRTLAKMISSGKAHFPQLTSDQFDRLRYKFDDAEQDTCPQDEKLQGERREKIDTTRGHLELNPHNLRLWRACARFLGCFPADIVGFDTHLEFRNDDGDAEQNTHIFSEAFCQALLSILLHPFFETDASKITLAIQYAVIVRTNDCRRWSMGRHSDTFLQTLQETIDTVTDTHTTMPTIRRLAMAAYMKTWWPKQCPLWSRFMDAIEERTITTRPKLTEAEGDIWHLPYICLARDAQTIQSALDDLEQGGLPVFLPVKIYELCLTGIQQEDDLPNVEILETRLLEETILHQKRQKTMAMACTAQQLDPSQILSGPYGRAARLSRCRFERDYSSTDNLDRVHGDIVRGQQLSTQGETASWNARVMNEDDIGDPSGPYREHQTGEVGIGSQPGEERPVNETNTKRRRTVSSTGRTDGGQTRQEADDVSSGISILVNTSSRARGEPEEPTSLDGLFEEWFTPLEVGEERSPLQNVTGSQTPDVTASDEEIGWEDMSGPDSPLASERFRLGRPHSVELGESED